MMFSQFTFVQKKKKNSFKYLQFNIILIWYMVTTIELYDCAKIDYIVT